MKQLSLTTRLALLFALLAFGAMSIVGYVLYRKLEAQLIVRDDAALVTRVDQIRTLMQDVDVRDLIHEKPHLFANMLGNTRVAAGGALSGRSAADRREPRPHGSASCDARAGGPCALARRRSSRECKRRHAVHLRRGRRARRGRAARSANHLGPADDRAHADAERLSQPDTAIRIDGRVSRCVARFRPRSARHVSAAASCCADRVNRHRHAFRRASTDAMRRANSTH